MNEPILRVLPGGLTDLRSTGRSGDRRRDVPCPSGERTATARPLPDDFCNAEWDALLACGQDAWHWRDPESLARLSTLLVRLERRVAEDWSR
jgi:hypothetical protein